MTYAVTEVVVSGTQCINTKRQLRIHLTPACLRRSVRNSLPVSYSMGKKFEDESLIQRLRKTLKHGDGLTASSKNYELQHFIPKYVCIPADSLKLFQLNKPCTRS